MKLQTWWVTYDVKGQKTKMLFFSLYVCQSASWLQNTTYVKQMRENNYTNKIKGQMSKNDDKITNKFTCIHESQPIDTLVDIQQNRGLKPFLFFTSWGEGEERLFRLNVSI